MTSTAANKDQATPDIRKPYSSLLNIRIPVSCNGTKCSILDREKEALFMQPIGSKSISPMPLNQPWLTVTLFLVVQVQKSPTWLTNPFIWGCPVPCSLPKATQAGWTCRNVHSGESNSQIWLCSRTPRQLSYTAGYIGSKWNTNGTSLLEAESMFGVSVTRFHSNVVQQSNLTNKALIYHPMVNYKTKQANLHAIV